MSAQPMFAGLRYLLGGYFHQDWDLEGSTPEEILLRVRKEAGSEWSDVAAKEAEALLLSDLSDLELARALDDRHMAYAPDLHGRTDREFLRLIVELLSTPRS